jgi:hypothetical protein
VGLQWTDAVERAVETGERQNAECWSPTVPGRLWQVVAIPEMADGRVESVLTIASYVRPLHSEPVGHAERAGIIHR